MWIFPRHALSYPPRMKMSIAKDRNTYIVPQIFYLHQSFLCYN